MRRHALFFGQQHLSVLRRPGLFGMMRRTASFCGPGMGQSTEMARLAPRRSWSLGRAHLGKGRMATNILDGGLSGYGQTPIACSGYLRALHAGWVDCADAHG